MKDGKLLRSGTSEVLVDKWLYWGRVNLMTAMLTKVGEKEPQKVFYAKHQIGRKNWKPVRFEYWKPGPTKYQAGFAGFFFPSR